MTPLTTESLNLEFNDDVACMTVRGVIGAGAMQEGLEWMRAARGAREDFNVRVNMAKSDFPDLSAVSKGFRGVADFLRAVPEARKCAIVTDSLFIQNTAKVEGAVIPGLTIRAFNSGEEDYASAWISGESLAQIVEAEVDAAQDVAPANDTDAPANPWNALKMSKVDY